jgi:hypothetical protein
MARAAILKESNSDLILASTTITVMLLANIALVELYNRDMELLLDKFRKNSRFVNSSYEGVTSHKGLYYWKV